MKNDKEKWDDVYYRYMMCPCVVGFYLSLIFSIQNNIFILPIWNKWMKINLSFMFDMVFGSASIICRSYISGVEVNSSLCEMGCFFYSNIKYQFTSPIMYFPLNQIANKLRSCMNCSPLLVIMIRDYYTNRHIVNERINLLFGNGWMRRRKMMGPFNSYSMQRGSMSSSRFRPSTIRVS